MVNIKHLTGQKMFFVLSRVWDNIKKSHPEKSNPRSLYFFMLSIALTHAHHARTHARTHARIHASAHPTNGREGDMKK